MWQKMVWLQNSPCYTKLLLGEVLCRSQFFFSLIYTHGWQPAVCMTLLLIDDMTGERYSLSLGQNTFIITVS